jgi:hypothetical protein
VTKSHSLANLALVVLALIVATMLCEVLARVFTPYPRRYAGMFPHEVLLFTSDPSLPGIDAHGFRNGRNMTHYDIAAIGDSHTFGYNVSPEASWPSVLSQMSGRRIYNFGAGGYNYLQYYYLADQALDLGVDVIIAFYPKNDLTQYICPTARLPFWRNFLDAEHLALPCDQFVDPFRYPLPILQHFEQSEPRARPIDQVAAFLQTHVALYALGEKLFSQQPTSLSGAKPGSVVYIAEDFAGQDQYGYLSEVMQHSLLSMDLGHAFVARSFEVAQGLFARLAVKARTTNRYLGFLLIPSRERLLYEALERPDTAKSPRFLAVTQEETLLVSRLSQFFQTHDLPYVDLQPFVLPAVKNALARGERFWPGYDGHPLQRGYAAYARGALALGGLFPAIECCEIP